MAVRELDSTAPVARPPRAMAWVLMLASAAAVAVVGLLATALVFGQVGDWRTPPSGFWPRFALASLLTIGSLALRSLRWIYLLRRADTRIPIRDAYIGYLAGFSLLLTPFVIGESAVRALINRRRGRVPVLTTLVVNVWERGCDAAALLAIAAATALAFGRRDIWAFGVLALVAATLIPALRRVALRVALGILEPVARVFEKPGPRDFRRLASQQTWVTALLTSIAAWALPGLGLWLIAGAWAVPLSVAEAEWSYAQASTLGAITLAPGGVLVAGRQMLDVLAMIGTPEAVSAPIVLGIRLATVGVSTALGVLFVVIHARTVPASSDTHFDDIADAYDVQIPEARRLALLELKTSLMKDVIARQGVGTRGLDVGCGQGAYVARMRELGFDVNGIDMSAGQIRLAAARIGDSGVVQVGSVLDIPADDGRYDFVYTINVLHHLPSFEDQQRAFRELFRVLAPGGLLFVHEINTRNALFRFYMGYVFPSLNCIDEGTERWLLPHRLHQYTDADMVEVRYFTFLPEFVSPSVTRMLRPMERALEQSSLAPYSAHYMAVLRKPGGPA